MRQSHTYRSRSLSLTQLGALLASVVALMFVAAPTAFAQTGTDYEVPVEDLERSTDELGPEDAEAEAEDITEPAPIVAENRRGIVNVDNAPLVRRLEGRLDDVGRDLKRVRALTRQLDVRLRSETQTSITNLERESIKIGRRLEALEGESDTPEEARERVEKDVSELERSVDELRANVEERSPEDADERQTEGSGDDS